MLYTTNMFRYEGAKQNLFLADLEKALFHRLLCLTEILKILVLFHVVEHLSLNIIHK